MIFDQIIQIRSSSKFLVRFHYQLHRFRGSLGKEKNSREMFRLEQEKDPETTLIVWVLSGNSVRENSKAFAMANALFVFPASMLRNLSNKLYKKHKNVALEVLFVSCFDRFWFLGFWVGFVGSWRTCVYIYLCVCVCVCMCIGRGNCEAARGDQEKTRRQEPG